MLTEKFHTQRTDRKKKDKHWESSGCFMFIISAAAAMVFQLLRALGLLEYLSLSFFYRHARVIAAECVLSFVL